MRVPLVLITTTISLLLAPVAQAKVYYLDATQGNDTTGDGSSTKPWKTFSHALGSILPGDTLEVRAGTYGEQVVVNVLGLSTDPVVLRAAPGASVVIDGSAVPLPQDEGLVYVTGTYVTVDGFEVKSSKRAGIHVFDKNNTIINCKVHDSLYSGIHFETADNSLVKGNTVYQNVQSNKGHTANQWDSGIWVDQSVGVHVEGNTIYNNHGEGLLVSQGKTNLAKGNTIYDNWSENLYTDNTEEVTVDGNFIYATPNSGFLRQGARPNGILIEDSNYGSGAKSAKGVFINNIVSGCEYNLVWYHSGLSGTGLKSVVIGNNTLVQAVSDGILIETGAHSNTTIANNIVVQSNTQMIAITGVTGLTFSANNWLGGSPGIATSPTDVLQNCQLADINAKDPNGFKIPTTSPCKDKGIPLVPVKTDFFGSARPVGSAHDIGAHEVGGVAPQPDSGPIQLDGGPTQLDGGPTQLDGGPTQLDGGPTQLDGGPTQLDGGPTQLDGGKKWDIGKKYDGFPIGEGGVNVDGGGGDGEESGCGCFLTRQARSERGSPLLLLLLILAGVGVILRRRGG
jgi:parallel beta-helix repeat protein